MGGGGGGGGGGGVVIRVLLHPTARKFALGQMEHMRVGNPGLSSHFIRSENCEKCIEEITHKDITERRNIYRRPDEIFENCGNI